MATLSGLLEQLDWRELAWGRLDSHRSHDEQRILELVQQWGISEKRYSWLLDATIKLRCSDEFDRLKRLALVALSHRPIVPGQMHERLAAWPPATKRSRRGSGWKGVDDDADRDPDGVISDRYVERDIERLQRDAGDTETNVGGNISGTSMNGGTPAKSVYEEHRQWAYKGLVGTVIEVADFEC
jgi:hypothetical protein